MDGKQVEVNAGGQCFSDVCDVCFRSLALYSYTGNNTDMVRLCVLVVPACVESNVCTCMTSPGIGADLGN